MTVEAQLKDLWHLAFGDDRQAIDGFFATAYSPERCRYIAENGRVLTAAYWLDGSYSGHKIAYVYAVATHPQARGKGLCRRNMACIHDALRQQGYAAAVLVPGEKSLADFYRPMGYDFFGGMDSFVAAAGENAAELRHIPLEEYARLREAMLPPGGIVQDKGSLSYLHSYARFAAGDDFVLAYSILEGKCLCHELLGNHRAAPEILKALGVAQGRFRTPGREPFAMCLPLEAVQLPAYFGLALD